MANQFGEEKVETRIFDRDLIFFDTETTGLAHSAEIIEIGFIKASAKTFQIIEEGDIKMKPDFPEKANAESLALVGYNEEEWGKEALSRREGFMKFLNSTKDTMLVGHNLPFDRMHVERELELLGLEPNYFYKGLDTFVMAWSVLGDRPEFVKFSLSELSKFYGIDQGRAHRAIDDARVTYRVFMELMKSQGEPRG